MLLLRFRKRSETLVSMFFGKQHGIFPQAKSMFQMSIYVHIKAVLLHQSREKVGAVQTAISK